MNGHHDVYQNKSKQQFMVVQFGILYAKIFHHNITYIMFRNNIIPNQFNAAFMVLNRGGMDMEIQIWGEHGST